MGNTTLSLLLGKRRPFVGGAVFNGNFVGESRICKRVVGLLCESDAEIFEFGGASDVILAAMHVAIRVAATADLLSKRPMAGAQAARPAALLPHCYLRSLLSPLSEMSVA